MALLLPLAERVHVIPALEGSLFTPDVAMSLGAFRPEAQGTGAAVGAQCVGADGVGATGVWIQEAFIRVVTVRFSMLEPRLSVAWGEARVASAEVAARSVGADRVPGTPVGALIHVCTFQCLEVPVGPDAGREEARHTGTVVPSHCVTAHRVGTTDGTVFGTLINVFTQFSQALEKDLATCGVESLLANTMVASDCVVADGVLRAGLDRLAFIYVLTGRIAKDKAIVTTTSVASCRIDAVGLPGAGPIAKAFVDVCATEIAWLAWDPVVASGRGEARQTAALVPSPYVSALGVRPTGCGVLGALVDILARHSQLYEAVLSVAGLIALLAFTVVTPRGYVVADGMVWAHAGIHTPTNTR